MGTVDVGRAFHCMTVPPKLAQPQALRTSIPIEADERTAVPIVADGPCECLDLDRLTEEEHDGQVRDAIAWLNGELGHGPQPLYLVLELLECSLEIGPHCAEHLFWRAHELGYVSLRQGVVSFGRVAVAR